jgi:hypothetical protein
MLLVLDIDLVTHRHWPGFDERGALVLPLPSFPGRALPVRCEIDGITLQRKAEFHLTLLSQTESESVRTRLDDGAIASMFAGMNWTCRAAGSCWFLRKVEDDGDTAHSVVMLCEAPAVNEFRSALSSRCAVALEPAPAHVTLFVAGQALGIGLSSHGDFHARRVRVVAESELDRNNVRE